jgi:hypothetical protein
VHLASSPKLFSALQGQEGHAKGWVGLLLRRTVGFDLNPMKSINQFMSKLRMRRTHSKDIVCINHPMPISIQQLECRPGNVFDQPIIGA